MINAIVIDDELKARRTLIHLLELTSPTVSVIGEAEGVQSGIDLINRRKPQLVFLDVQMMDGTGFDLLDAIRFSDFHLIFTTAHSEFAVKAFRYSAIDYLVKPVDPKELMLSVQKVNSAVVGMDIKQKLTRLMEQFEARTTEKITLSTQEGILIVAVEDIIRLESDRSYTTFHKKGGERVIVARNLKSFETLLPELQFVRPHKSHLVNIDYIAKILKREGDFLELMDGSKIPISRRKKERLLEHLSRQNFL